MRYKASPFDWFICSVLGYLCCPCTGICAMYYAIRVSCCTYSCADPEGGTGKNHTHIGFASNSGPDPLKNHEATCQHSMLGHHQHVIKTPFKWRFAGGAMMTGLSWYLDPPTPHQLKKAFKVGPPLTKFSGSAHDIRSNIFIGL